MAFRAHVVLRLSPEGRLRIVQAVHIQYIEYAVSLLFGC